MRAHTETGDKIRLLKYLATNTVKYVAELRLDPADPWRWRDGPDRKGSTRKIIQFRFLPVGETDVDAGDPVHEPSTTGESVIDDLPRIVPEPTTTAVEALRSSSYQQGIRARQILAQRREQQLVHKLRDWLEDEHGLLGSGLRIPYTPESRPLRVDLFIERPRLLIEAKSSASRESIRLAIGQLLDYRRWIMPHPSLAVLVPTEPPSDMIELLAGLGIGAVWPSRESFVVHPPGLL